MILGMGLGVGVLWCHSTDLGFHIRWWDILGLVACLIGIGCGTWHCRRIRRAFDVFYDMERRLRQRTGPGTPEPEPVSPTALAQSVLDGLESCVAAQRRLESQAEDLQIQSQLLLRQKKNIEDIVYSLQDAVLVMDDADRLLLANRAAERLFGFDRRVAEHETLATILQDQANEFIDLIQAERKHHADTTRHTLVLESAEDRRTYDCIISRIHDVSLRTTQVVAVLRDVTRETEVAKIKNDFVSYVSHELKTPLASITAYVEMLMDGEADDEAMRQEFYGVIQGQAKRLNRLIENILNVSRIESGLMKIEKESVSLTILVDEQIQLIRGYAEDRKVRVIGRKPIVFDQVYADRDMMSQVIINLLSNAIKYNCSGGTVTVETDVDETQALVRVCVHDTGVGIPKDELEHVFDKFYRATSNEDRAEGTGLGLSLVQQIVENLHGGRVFVKSQVGAGSTFGFELPLASHQEVHTFV